MMKLFCLILFVAISSSVANKPYSESITTQRELIRGAKRICLTKYSLSSTIPLPKDVLKTDPKTACSFHCSILELGIINDNGINEANLMAENVAIDHDQTRRLIEMYNDLCSKDHLLPYNFFGARREFSKLPEEILLELGYLYQIWSKISVSK
ncbi:uncharacterized protein LOC116344275 [Contarinia nasturtii]|uniref:uncharacterized protein LOC116344275 n=1 Tax=Contarinia nasturtii TaxID=265458 RepID=UPI0012D37D17|nr:uncharacterized protein LOC116344275 [Contarinia nasturtii]